VVIEFLKFKVTPELREKFIQKDAEIWTAALTRYPGFLSKEVWIDPNAPAEVVIVIRWATREQWKAIPTEQLEKIDARFAQQTGKTCELIQSSEYQVRKFPQS
jgi:uncharacterized protein (TIGR03792 family)